MIYTVNDMASPFQAPPAGTEVPPSSDARYFYRRQVYSRNPVTGDNWTGGRTVNFQAEASGGHYLVPSECRIVAKIKVKKTGGSALVEKSVRFATDPIHCGLFEAGMLSVRQHGDSSRLQRSLSRADAKVGGGNVITIRIALEVHGACVGDT